MLDILTRMLISVGILAGTTYLPALSEAVSARTAAAEGPAVPARACAARPVGGPGARAVACVG